MAAATTTRDVLEQHSTLEELRQSLIAKQWWGFDLDDTLHHFRAASGKAAAAVFDQIHAAHPSIPAAELKEAYGHILRSNTAPAFTDGRTSTEYRRERFGALLRAFGIVPEDLYLDVLAARYKEALRAALSLKPGALALLRLLKSTDVRPARKVVVVTEGPLDAQRWTLDMLGLTAYVDVLASSGGMRASKTEGLFERVFMEYGIVPEDMVFIGDSVERDVAPALKSGVGIAIYVGEGGDEMIEGVVEREKPRFTAVRSLEAIVQALA